MRSTLVAPNATCSVIQDARPGSTAEASSPTTRATIGPLSGTLSHGTTARPGRPSARRPPPPPAGEPQRELAGGGDDVGVRPVLPECGDVGGHLGVARVEAAVAG